MEIILCYNVLRSRKGETIQIAQDASESDVRGMIEDIRPGPMSLPDVDYPFCYVGDDNHKDEVVVVWAYYGLQRTYPL